MRDRLLKKLLLCVLIISLDLPMNDPGSQYQQCESGGYTRAPVLLARMIRWMYSGNESQGFSSGVTLGVQKLLWAYPGVHFAFIGSYAHGDRVYRLRREILHNFMSNPSGNGLLEP